MLATGERKESNVLPSKFRLSTERSESIGYRRKDKTKKQKTKAKPKPLDPALTLARPAGRQKTLRSVGAENRGVREPWEIQKIARHSAGTQCSAESSVSPSNAVRSTQQFSI